VVRRGRFDGRDIKPGARHLALVERLSERLFVHESAARRVDEKGPFLHHGKFGRADHTPAGGSERSMQRNDVALPQHLLKRCIERTHSRRALVVRE
jgi:hypothetical protein